MAGPTQELARFIDGVAFSDLPDGVAHTYNGTFLGFAPLTNPAIVVVVTLNGTHGNAGFGGAAAAPVFRTVATEALRVLDVPKDLPDEPPTLIAKGPQVQDLADADDGSDNILEDGGDDDDAPVDAAPPPPQTGPAGNTGPDTEKIPNFRGMSMRAVMAEATSKGLIVLPEGSGTARLQSPPPGSPMRPGQHIRVQFAR